jgi:uncharacterized protein YjgD (DUF1641 family)
MTPPTAVAQAQTSQLDRIEAQLAGIVAELEATRRERDRWRELSHELMPVAQGAMSMASRELEDLGQEVTVEDLTRFARTAVRSLPRLEALLVQLESLTELLHEATSLTGAGMATLSTTLATAGDKGYFTFVRGASAIVDEVVESFGEEDLKALGANVVLILQTVKQMTQPQILRFLSTTVAEVQEVDDAPAPSTVHLLRQMRDPQVRRGLARTLTVLGDLGAATSRKPKSKDGKAKAGKPRPAVGSTSSKTTE